MMKYPIGIQSFDKIRACLNFAQGYLTNKIGKTDREQTQKNLIEYYFIGKFKQALITDGYVYVDKTVKHAF